ncbi:PqiB family protein [Halovulum sp. GXIMD14794]
MTDQLPDPQMQGPKPGLWQRISPVWLVPIIAVLISVLVVWQNYASRGPVIEILFENASGVVAKQTTLHYRDVPVGVVEKVQFAAGLENVIVSVRLEPEVAPYVDSESQFWVVRPQLTTRGVSGLETVISGVYIEGIWDTNAGTSQYRFTGLEQAPISRSDREGVTVVLESRDGDGLAEGTPVLYRGIEVGAVGRPQLSEDGNSVIAEAFIEAPYARHVTTATRFWNASGFSLTFGPGGAQLDVSSLASLVAGGVSFDTVINTGRPIEPNANFELFASEQDARSSLFSSGGAPMVRLSMIFEGDTAGLDAGAAIDLGGVEVGRVAAVSGVVDEDRFNDGRVRMLATAEIDPAKLGFSGDDAQQQTLDFLADAVTRGQRAQLEPASILTGGLRIVVSPVDGAAPAEFAATDTPFPEFPTLPYEGSGTASSVEGLIDRVANLPFEDMMDEAVGVLQNVNGILEDENIRRIPQETADLMAAARGVVDSDEVQALPEQVGNLLGSLESAAGQAEQLIARLTEAGAAEQLAQTLEAAARAADGIALTAEDLPALVEDLQTLAGKVQELPLGDVVANADGLLTDARNVLSDPAIQGIPAQVETALTDLGSAVADARELVAGLAEGTVSEDLAATLASARQLTEDLAAAADQVPGLMGRLDATAANVQDLPLDRIAEQLSGVLENLRGLTATEAAQALPSQAGAALASLEEALQRARDLLGAVDAQQLSADISLTLTDARRAAASVAEATEALPGLTERLDNIATRAEQVPLDQLAAEAEGLLADARRVIGTDDAQALPGALNGALAQIEAVLADLREGGVAENTNATLAAAREAAESVATAAESLPALTARLQTLSDQARLTLSSVDSNSRLYSEISRMLSAVEGAARSVNSLSRAIERDPNSLILGR